MEQLSLQDRVVVVTGAGSRGPGIGNGRAAAIVLARAGARVAMLDQQREWAQETLELVEAEGNEAMVLEADVSDTASVKQAVDQVVAEWGAVYGLVNNVGIGGPLGSAVDVDPDDWDLCMQVNVKSMMVMAKYCLPSMIERGGGSIVNLSSVAGLKGGIPHLAYPTSKAAVIGLTRAMASQHGRQGVRVNCVAPGMVYTPMVATRGMTEEVRAARRSRSLLGTEGTGWDVAGAIGYLLSDASRWVTGVVLPVDAGASSGTTSYPEVRPDASAASA